MSRTNRAGRPRGPRPLAAALDAVLASAAPATLLARVQEAWPQAAGPVVAAESQPVSERAGLVTVECSSAAWAQELELLSRDLLERLQAALAGGGGEAPRAVSLRFVAGRRQAPP